MCGIAGVFGDHVDRDPLILEGVRRLLGGQAHRGPDDEGWLTRKDLVLGHRRLSIVDLSPLGRQPMSNEDDSIWVVYNGEIYNHQQLRRELQERGHHFSSASDTEAIIHGYEEWGIEGLLHRLRGMFAFALYDGRQTPHHPRLILARDRLGIKPLYFAPLPNRNGLVFASEVRALLCSGLIPRDEDPRARLAFLLFGSIPSPWTTVKAVQALPAGQYLVADGRELQPIRYYALERCFSSLDSSAEPQSGGEANVEALEKGIRATLEETVALHLISDAPLGVFLSGGIDSSALVALAAPRKPDLITLGVVFEEQRFSEEPYQKLVAEKYATRHHRVAVTIQDFQDELKRFLEVMDQPTLDGLNTYFVAKAARQVGLKAVLSGIGGDEIFCGYPTLRRAPTLWRLRGLPHPLRAGVITLGTFRPSLRKLAFLRRNGNLPFYLVQRGLFTPGEAARLLDAKERDAWGLIESLEPPEAPRDPVRLQQFLEARHYLVDQLLKDADVFGMAHSVEIRVPFLDHTLVEEALGAPRSLQLDRRWPKSLLTRSLRDLLPEQIVFRPKQGFTFPIEVWLRSIGDLITDNNGYWLNGAYRAAWEEFVSGRIHWSRPWALTVLAHVFR